MNEINYPTPETQGPFISYKHSFNSSFRSSERRRRPGADHVHPLKKRTRLALCCWSSLLLFALACLCVAVFSIVLVPNYGISVGIPILLVGAACTGISIFCFYTMYAVPECRPEANMIGDMSRRGGDTSCQSDGVTTPTRLQNEGEESGANVVPLLKD